MKSKDEIGKAGMLEHPVRATAMTLDAPSYSK
jgi:hypothetical protein